MTDLKANSIANLTGTFDIIFVDANKDGYLGYVQAILDQRLLSHNGVIVCDNGNISTPPPSPHHPCFHNFRFVSPSDPTTSSRIPQSRFYYSTPEVFCLPASLFHHQPPTLSKRSHAPFFFPPTHANTDSIRARYDDLRGCEP